jgi:hypothetical protein
MPSSGVFVAMELIGQVAFFLFDDVTKGLQSRTTEYARSVRRTAVEKPDYRRRRLLRAGRACAHGRKSSRQCRYEIASLHILS